MFSRSLPRFPDLTSFLDFLDKQGDVRDVAAPVDMRLEVTEIHRRVIEAGGPVLRFSAPTVGGKPSAMPVVASWGKDRSGAQRTRGRKIPCSAAACRAFPISPAFWIF